MSDPDDLPPDAGRQSATPVRDAAWRGAVVTCFVLVAVNLDPHNSQGGHFEVPLWEFGLADHASVDVEDLATGSKFTWTGKIQHMLLEPGVRPYAIWRLSKRQDRA